MLRLQPKQIQWATNTACNKGLAFEWVADLSATSVPKVSPHQDLKNLPLPFPPPPAKDPEANETDGLEEEEEEKEVD